MQWVIFVGVGLWFVFGDPSRDIAGWFWEYDAAPWERVDAFYYPDRSNLERYEFQTDVGGVEECRDWVHFKATGNGDPGLTRGDYECGVGEPKDWYGIRVYRTTVD